MTIPNPEHLLQQAEKLLAPPPAGPPRQADLRRAISSAYYAVFHATLTAAADEFVGRRHRKSALYALVYRGIEHSRIKEVCGESQKPQQSRAYAKYVPAKGMGPNIQAFSLALADLQERRHAADYDPLLRLKTSDAIFAVANARIALQRFARANQARRRTFLGFLLF